MERMNDSKRWSEMVVEELQYRHSRFGICLVLNDLRNRGSIDFTIELRMERQMWAAAKKGKLRGVIKERAADGGGGYLWPKRYKTIRIEAARKLSRIVKR